MNDLFVMKKVFGRYCEKMILRQFFRPQCIQKLIDTIYRLEQPLLPRLMWSSLTLPIGSEEKRIFVQGSRSIGCRRTSPEIRLMPPMDAFHMAHSQAFKRRQTAEFPLLFVLTGSSILERLAGSAFRTTLEHLPATTSWKMVDSKYRERIAECINVLMSN
jgi:hypothetical protein